MFIINKNLPYYIKDDKIYPCIITATAYKVDFKSPNKKPNKIDCILTDEEVRAKLGIRLVDGWDAVNNKVKKVSNKKVSSIATTTSTK